MPESRQMRVTSMWKCETCGAINGRVTGQPRVSLEADPHVMVCRRCGGELARADPDEFIKGEPIMVYPLRFLRDAYQAMA